MRERGEYARAARIQYTRIIIARERVRVHVHAHACIYVIIGQRLGLLNSVHVYKCEQAFWGKMALFGKEALLLHLSENVSSTKLPEKVRLWLRDRL